MAGAPAATPARDIRPETPPSRDCSSTAVAARSVPGAVTRSQAAAAAAAAAATATAAAAAALPTPPHSFSPALGPSGLLAQLQKAAAAAAAATATETSIVTPKLEPVDSDLDLRDADDRKAADTPDAVSSAGSDSAGAITSTMLARCHLADILLSRGPLAIRHIMTCLAASVPGFAAIPPTKARRLVVAALEGRGGGGLDGDVEFEKIGWGRWRAHQARGGRHHHSGNHHHPPHPPLRVWKRSPPLPDRAGSPRASTLPIPERAGGPSGRGRGAAPDICRTLPSGSSGGGSTVLSFDGRDQRVLRRYRRRRHHAATAAESEVDRMSLDEAPDEGSASASASCSEAADDYDIEINYDNPDDATDEEDWAAIGAAALRAGSYPSSVAAPVTDGRGIWRVRNPCGFLRSAGPGAAFGVAAAAPSPSPSASRLPVFPRSSSFDPSAALSTSNAQEREAVEALLSLGTG